MKPIKLIAWLIFITWASVSFQSCGQLPADDCITDSECENLGEGIE